MNRLPATIEGIESADGLHLLALQIGTQACTAFTSATQLPWHTGDEVQVVFRELDVAIATRPCPEISIRNSLSCVIVQIQPGRLFSELTLACDGLSLQAVITRRSCEKLALTPGMTVQALIKANALQLQEYAA